MIQQNREPRDLRPRAAISAVFAVLAFIIVLARLYHLQLVRGPEFAGRSRENYIKELIEPADRGVIVDRRGRTLAGNRPSFDIYVTPAFCPSPDEVVPRIAEHLGLTAAEEASVLKALKGIKRSEQFRPYLVKLDVDRDQLDRLQADLPMLPGVEMIPSPHRRYGPLAELEENRPFGSMLAHVVGYMSEVSQTELESAGSSYRRGDFVGRRGVERSYENLLRGLDGKRFVAVDARGRELDRATQDLLIPEAERRQPSRPGNSLEMTLDLGLQVLATRAMEAGARAGAAAVVDVHTGFVLALVSYPSYDPNLLTGRISRKELQALVDDPMQPLFSRATQQHYHPGSTFKVVPALAALAAGLTTPESSTTCGGGYTVGARRWRCHNERGHGAGIDLRRSLLYSCDVYYYWVADRIGLDPIAEMATRMGFGRPTGVELAPEAAGLVPTVAYHQKTKEGYARGYALNTAIGQGSVNVTVLQLAMAYAAIANGGTLYRPRLVRRVLAPDGTVVRDVQPDPVGSLGVSPAALKAVMGSLEAVVHVPGGTAYAKRLAGIRVAGKTGTAQNVVIGDRRLSLSEMKWAERDHAWFAAVAPAEAPEIAVVVLNEHGGHGGAAAAPIAMGIIQGYFDLKAREAVTPLSPQELPLLQPDPRFASQVRVDAGPRDPVMQLPVPGVVGRDEPMSSAAEVANPDLLRRPVLDTPKPVRRPRVRTAASSGSSDVEPEPAQGHGGGAPPDEAAEPSEAPPAD